MEVIISVEEWHNDPDIVRLAHDGKVSKWFSRSQCSGTCKVPPRWALEEVGIKIVDSRT